MLDLIGVIISRRFKFEHYKSNLLLNYFSFVIIIAAVAAEAYADGAGCETLRTCAQCTAGSAATACRWYFADQRCAASSGGDQSSPAAAAAAAADCPKFSSGGHTDRLTVTVVSSDVFARFLANSSRVACRVNENAYRGFKDDNGTTIVCEPDTGDDDGAPAQDDAPAAEELCPRVSIAYVTIAVDDGPSVVFDDARDHYVPLHGPTCEETCRDPGSRTTCLWDVPPYRHYCTWCPAGGDRLAAYRACDRRRLSDPRRADDHSETVPLEGRCTRGVASFSPDGGPWSGGTVVRAVVPDRDTLFWDAADDDVSVTVAGRDCARPRWSGHTVACTVSPPPPPPYVGDDGSEPATAGPVVLTFRGPPEVSVSSAQDFRFIRGSEPGNDTAAAASGGDSISARRATGFSCLLGAPTLTRFSAVSALYALLSIY